MAQVALAGFLEMVAHGQARGWAWDAANPGEHVAVTLFLDGQSIGAINADRFRDDLKAANIGDGDHAFICSFATDITEADASRIDARVLTEAEGIYFRLSRMSPDGTVSQGEWISQPSQIVIESALPDTPAALTDLHPERDVFVHIPKAAGTTIRSIISRQYGAAATLYFEPDSDTWDYRADPLGYLTAECAARPVALITGHHRFGVHEYTRHVCRYFTMLRDPLDRAISDFFYAFSFPDHRHRDEIRDGTMSFSDFIRRGDGRPATAHTYLLGGMYSHIDGQVAMAKQNLMHSFAAVGVMERFDESLLHIAKQLGWQPPLYVRRNVTPLSPELRATRRIATQTAIRDHQDDFAGDYALYAAAEARLDAWISGQGAAFVSALQAFRWLQSALAAMETDAIYDQYKLEEDDPLPLGVEELTATEQYQIVAAYLGSGAALSSQARQYVGAVDRRTEGLLEGWAIDLSRDAPIDVTLRLRGKVVDRMRSDRPRPDVVHDGYPRAEVGFEFELPWGIDPNDFKVCFEDSGILIEHHRW